MPPGDEELSASIQVMDEALQENEAMSEDEKMSDAERMEGSETNNIYKEEYEAEKYRSYLNS
ncbi:hypothetical protein EV178_004698 [Coemansia sp. RSA 1646]|nr:hypothetical protein EV178_004698 [Coemansia sp. RSA 1646]